MWQYLFGFSTGIYVGTYYECKPTIDKIIKWLESQKFTDKKD